MRSERMQGDERDTYVALEYSSMTKHGMAYGARALGSRSAIVLVGVTTHQGARESRAQGEVAQVAG